jgi:hypothetical protein
MLALDYRPSKRLIAALKLAAVYAAAVTLLLMVLTSISDSPARVLKMLPFYGIPGAICFAGAFLLLAVARRAGFTALWLTILGLWTTALVQDFEPYAVRGGFAFFTLLAAPLYAMCALGFPHPSATRARWRQLLSITGGLAWAALFVVALRQLHFLDAFERRQYVAPWLWSSLQYACLVIPPAVTLAGILRVYSRTPAHSSDAAA